jgi:excisionase family DNA binding protein
MTDLAQSWLTIDAAAAATGRSERTIRRWITDQRLRHLEFAGVRYVNERELLHLERTTRHAARQGRPGARARAC